VIKIAGCPLCEGAGGATVFQGARFRVVRAAEPGLPAFYRLVWSAHVREFSDLAPDDRHFCIDAVTCVEEALRQHLDPVKVNLATLGNAVPHLHWHIVGRFAWDSHFPAAPWAPAQRNVAPEAQARIEGLLPALEADIAARLAALPGNRAPS
jgi:diadenosine tetraphosphate (Ap4A) HIT family hydrolase